MSLVTAERTDDGAVFVTRRWNNDPERPITDWYTDDEAWQLFKQLSKLYAKGKPK